MTRREFLATTAAVAGASAMDRGAEPARSAWRADFPMTASGVYMNAAAIHPLSVPASRALHAYMDARLYGRPGDFDAAKQAARRASRG